MPRSNPIMPSAAPIRAVLPTKKHPHLREVVKQLDFVCSTCSSAYGAPVFRSFMDAAKDPISGPENYTTRFLVRCPECNTIPTDGPFISNGIIELLQVPANYKRPKRPTVNVSEDNLGFQDEDDEPLVSVPPTQMRTSNSRPKKASDLSPATRGKKAKGAIKATAVKKKINAAKAAPAKV